MPMPGHTSVLAPLTWYRLLAVWQPHPLLLGIAGVAVLGYVFAVQEVSSRGQRWPYPRTAAFVCGVAVVVWAVCGGPGSYGEVLFWVHMVRHLLLIMIGPWLVALGRPVLLVCRASGSRPWVPGRWQVVATGGYVTVVAGLHLTGFMQAMMDHPILAPVENVVCVGAGCLFFAQVVAAAPTPVLLVLESVAMAADAVVGVIVQHRAVVPWPAYAHPQRAWGPDPLTDLHLGGLVMWLGGGGLMLVMVIVLAARLPTTRTPAGHAPSARRRLDLVDQPITDT